MSPGNSTHCSDSGAVKADVSASDENIADVSAAIAEAQREAEAHGLTRLAYLLGLALVEAEAIRATLRSLCC